jgi:hypothetical protein
MIDRAIFENLQAKIDEEAAVRDVRPTQTKNTACGYRTNHCKQELRDIVQNLSRKGLARPTISGIKLDFSNVSEQIVG